MFPLYAIFILLPATTLAADGVTSVPGCNRTVELKSSVVALQFYDSINTDNNTEISSGEIDAYFKSFDSNDDGIVEKDEFVAFVDANYAEFKCHEWEVYENFDFNKDKILNETDFNLVIGLADENKDTVITEKEFVTVFTLLMEALEELIDLDSLVNTTTTGTK